MKKFYRIIARSKMTASRDHCIPCRIIKYVWCHNCSAKIKFCYLNRMKRLLNTSNAPLLLCRIVVGLIFLSEGIQKFILAAPGVDRFTKIGFSHPSFWACFVGTFEIVCGILILIGLVTRFAAIPLLIVMLVAFVTTKIPILTGKGFWSFAHEYRTDFATTLLLILLLIYGGGNHSVDRKISNAKTANG